MIKGLHFGFLVLGFAVAFGLVLSGCGDNFDSAHPASSPVDMELESLRSEVDELVQTAAPYLKVARQRATGPQEFSGFSFEKEYLGVSEDRSIELDLIATLEKPGPDSNIYDAKTQKNLLELRKTAVVKLFDRLLTYQTPLRDPSESAFIHPVKSRVEQFKEHAVEANFEIVQDRFVFGLEPYTKTLPSPKMAPILLYELKAMDHLLRTLISSEADSMHSFTRDIIPGEVGGPEKHESKVIHKYPVRLGFECSGKALRSFFNSIFEDKSYFYVVRELNVQSNSDDAERLLETKRSTKVLGDGENLKVFAIIDIVRFLDPSEYELNEVVP